MGFNPQFGKYLSRIYSTMFGTDWGSIIKKHLLIDLFNQNVTFSHIGGKAFELTT